MNFEPSMPWGKHRGVAISKVPLSYLAWVVESSDDFSVKTISIVEIKRRMESLLPSIKTSSNENRKDEKCKNALRRLSLLSHPDRGGSVESMKIVNELRELLA